jgi:uncharacterized protein (TIGR01777 family)
MSFVNIPVIDGGRMKIFITGGTGFVGQHLADRLIRDGHEPTILSRGKSKPMETKAGLRYVHGDPTQKGPWQGEVAKQDALINLAGTTIFGRWTTKRKRQIRDSRILTTRNLVEAIPLESATSIFSTSAVGYYGFHGDEQLDEASAPGDDFLAKLATDWEAEAKKAKNKGVRVVITRFGVVMGRGAGALPQMVTPFKWFLGGPIGSGMQWLSWIHIDDLVGAFVHLLAHPDLDGAFNLTAPHPARNRDFSKVLGKVLKRPSWMPAPAFMVQLVLGEFGSVILKGQRVLPRRLLESGFSFRHPELEDALRHLLS